MSVGASRKLELYRAMTARQKVMARMKLVRKNWLELDIKKNHLEHKIEKLRCGQ